MAMSGAPRGMNLNPMMMHGGMAPMPVDMYTPFCPLVCCIAPFLTPGHHIAIREAYFLLPRVFSHTEISTILGVGTI